MVYNAFLKVNTDDNKFVDLHNWKLYLESAWEMHSNKYKHA